LPFQFTTIAETFFIEDFKKIFEGGIFY